MAFALGKDADGVDLTMLYPVGFFGWTGLPFAFHVISAVIERRVNDLIHGESEVYVDDLMGGSALDELEHNLAIARKVCTDLLGPNAVADDKTMSGRVIDFIGWEFNLDLKTVTIARRNFMRTLYGMIRVRCSSQQPTGQ